jgi:uncharacterized membrane protein
LRLVVDRIRQGLVDKNGGLMAEDDKPKGDKPSRDDLSQIDERLKYLETIARETVARLYVIESRLGLAHKDPWVKRDAPPAQHAPTQGQRVPPVPVPPTAQTPAPAAQQPPTPGQQIPAHPSPHAGQTPPSAAPPLRPPAQPRPPQSSVLGIPPLTQAAPPPVGQPPSAQPPRVGTSRVASAMPPSKPRKDLEARIGGNWFNRIGVIAIVLGVGFFFKYAYDNGWIQPWEWVSIGLALGVAFLIGGEKTRKKYATYAYGLTGCGISILYLSVFAAFKLWGLVGQPTAFVAMALVTATASLIAARYNALAIAILGLIGGFLTPGLLSTGVDNQVGLFGYITLLDAGVLVLAYRKQWRTLNYLAFVATVLTFVGWAVEFYTAQKLTTTVVFLSIFFVIFALLAVLYNVINHRPTTWLDLGLVFVNAVLYFSTSYELLEDDYHSMLGAFAIVVAAFYMGLGYVTYRRDKEDTLLVHTFLGLAFLFSVLAVPIQFDQQWVTMAWAVEGAIMTWVGLRADDRVSRYAGLIVFIVAAGHFVQVDLHDFAYQSGRHFTPLLNNRALSCAVLVAALTAATRLFHRHRETLDEEEHSMFASLYALGANAAAILLLSLDANDYFESARDSGRWPADAVDMWNNARQFTLSALWTVYGVVTLIVGITRRQKLVRGIGAVILGVTTVKVLVVDLAFYGEKWHTTFFNETFAILAMLVFGLSFVVWLYSRSDIAHAEKRIAMPVLIIAANVLALIALTIEPVGYFDRAISISGSSAALQLNNWMQFVLTAIWTTYAAVALGIGFRRKSQSIRVGALLLLGISTLKVLLVDAAFYHADWHRPVLNQTFGAFVLLVAVMAMGSYLYSRMASSEEEERPNIAPLLTGAANILAIIALSLEAIGYYRQAIESAQKLSSPVAEIARLENSLYFSLTAIWTIYAAAAIVIGVQRNSRWTRWGGFLLLGLAATKVLFADATYYAASWHKLVINESFGAFALVIGAMSLAVYYYSRSANVGNDERNLVSPVLVAAANVFAIIALSLEGFGHYAVKLGAPGLSAGDADDLRLAQQLSLSVIWTVYGGGLLMAGIWRRSRMLRVMALGLLSITILKVFLVDLSSLEKIYRIISFIVLGAILLGVSYLYQRYRQRTSGVESANGRMASTQGALADSDRPEEAR